MHVDVALPWAQPQAAGKAQFGHRRLKVGLGRSVAQKWQGQWVDTFVTNHFVQGRVQPERQRAVSVPPTRPGLGLPKPHRLPNAQARSAHCALATSAGVALMARADRAAHLGGGQLSLKRLLVLAVYRLGTLRKRIDKA